MGIASTEHNQFIENANIRMIIGMYTKDHLSYDFIMLQKKKKKFTE